MQTINHLATIIISQGAGGVGDFLSSPIIMFLLMFLIIYLMLIRPQQKQQKKHRELIESLKRGDKIITQSGIYGKISAIEGNVVTLEIDHKVNIRILKAQIAGLELPETKEAKAEEKETKEKSPEEKEKK